MWNSNFYFSPKNCWAWQSKTIKTLFPNINPILCTECVWIWLTLRYFQLMLHSFTCRNFGNKFESHAFHIVDWYIPFHLLFFREFCSQVGDSELVLLILLRSVHYWQDGTKSSHRKRPVECLFSSQSSSHTVGSVGLAVDWWLTGGENFVGCVLVSPSFYCCTRFPRD